METQYLRYFVAVARTLNFNRAARECHVSQPALSAQIKKFEEALGCSLFNRTKRSVELTREGRELLPKAINILAEMQSIQEHALEMQNPMQGTLKVGFSSLISITKTFCSVRKLQEKFPQLELEFQELVSTELLQKLRLGEFDIILIPLLDEEPMDAYFTKEFERTPLVMIRAHDCPKKALTQFVGLGTRCPMRFLMDRAARSTGEHVRSRFSADDLGVVRKIVAMGIGWSIVPESILTAEDRSQFIVKRVKGFECIQVMVVNRSPRGQVILDAFLDNSCITRDLIQSKVPSILPPWAHSGNKKAVLRTPPSAGR